VNLFEGLFVALVVGLVWLASKLLGRALGVNWWWAAAVVGPVVVLLLALLFRHLARQYQPPCARCGARDYEGGATHEGADVREYGHICRCRRCGTKYVECGKRFELLGQDGRLTNYKRRRLFRGWIHDVEGGR
jgi:hypothetical protein